MRVDRISLLALGAAGVWFTLVLRTFQIQVVEGNYYESRAEGQAIRRELWKPERGRILDRNGEVLAINASNPLTAKRSGGRIFPDGRLAAQLLGRVGADGVGQMGLEYHFEELLRGVDGWTYKTLDSRRRELPGSEKNGRPPTPGMDLVLTIDRDIQEIVEVSLERGVKKLEANRACALVMDPRTGEILAMAGYPDFDPNDPSSLSKGYTRNDLVSLVYEPGSTFKIVAAGAALEEQSVRLGDSIDASGGKLVLSNGEIINDTHDYGVVSVSGAMAYSSNVAFAKIAQKVGQDKFFRYVRQFGFGVPTGIESPGEERGAVKPVHLWSGRTLLTMAMGHEILVTPIQMAAAFAVIANGGNLVRPTLVKELREAGTGNVVRKNEPQIVRRVIGEEIASQIRGMLRGVVEYGTAKGIESTIVPIAGKTGTAEKYSTIQKGYDRSAMTSSFIGFVPANDPRYLCLVLVDEPKTAHVGGVTAAPMFKEIVERIHYAPSTSPTAYRLVHAAPPQSCKEGDPEGLPPAMAEAEVRKGGCISKLSGRGSMVIASVRRPAHSGADTVELQLGDLPKGTMPDLRGRTLREAVRLMGALGAHVQFAGRGWVSEQMPAPDSPLRSGASCRLTLREAS